MKKTESRLKALFVGDLGSGKTSARKALAENLSSQKDYTPTTGVDLSLIVQTKGSQTIRLQVWDIAGNERFGTMLRTYFKEAQIASIFVPIDKDFERQKAEISAWANHLQAKIVPPVHVTIVLSKADKDKNINVDQVKSRIEKWFLETYPSTPDFTYAGLTAISVKDNNFESLRNLLFDTAKIIAAANIKPHLLSVIEKKHFPEKYDKIVAEKEELQDKLIALFDDYTSWGVHWRHHNDEAKKIVNELRTSDLDADELLEKFQKKYEDMLKLVNFDQKGTFAEILLYAIKLIDEFQHQPPKPK